MRSRCDPIARPLGRLSVVTRLAFLPHASPAVPRLGGDSTDLARDSQGQFRPVGGVTPTGASSAHGLENHPLRPLAIPFALEDPLPGPKIESTGGHGNDHFVSDRERSQMRRGIVLTGSAVVPIAIWLPRRDRPLE